MALKPCSECKKEISSDVSACPQCGKKSPHGMSMAAKVIVGFFISCGVLYVIGAASGEKPAKAQAYQSSTDRAAQPKAEPTQEVTTKQLYAIYHKNEVRADNEWKGHTVKLSGAVYSVDKGMMGGVTMWLGGSAIDNGIMVKLDGDRANEVAKFDKGDVVTVTCTVGTMVMGTPTCDM